MRADTARAPGCPGGGTDAGAHGRRVATMSCAGHVLPRTRWRRSGGPRHARCDLFPVHVQYLDRIGGGHRGQCREQGLAVPPSPDSPTSTNPGSSNSRDGSGEVRSRGENRARSADVASSTAPVPRPTVFPPRSRCTQPCTARVRVPLDFALCRAGIQGPTVTRKIILSTTERARIGPSSLRFALEALAIGELEFRKPAPGRLPGHKTVW